MFFVGLILKSRISVLMEAIQAFLTFVLFILAALISMYFAEKDPHLQYLTNREEWEHKYFKLCRLQSVISLATGFMFLVHGTLMADVLLIKDDSSLQ